MGYGNRWTSWRDVSGSIQCTNGAFGGDPAPGQAKECVCDTGAALCVDDCNWVNDGDCDDGGPGWEYTLCDLGADCTDCGARLCIDDCNWVNDGDCDDGGPGREYTLCELGTDCTDCGARAAALLQMPPSTKSRKKEKQEEDKKRKKSGVLLQSHKKKTEGVSQCACENPGHGTFASCTSSRTCNCNGQVRMGYGNRWTSWRDVSGSIQCTNGAFGEDPAPGQAKECVCDTGAALCIDDCNWVNDGDCDDGGPGWEYTLCDLGADCT